MPNVHFTQAVQAVNNECNLQGSIQEASEYSLVMLGWKAMIVETNDPATSQEVRLFQD